MKIENKDITIKVGNKEKNFKNLILDNYIDLFADSFLDFKDKILDNCFVKFNNTQDINENSTEMDYDVILEVGLDKLQEIYTNNTIINKYIYNTPVWDEGFISDHIGEKICGIGFGSYDYELKKYILYAFLDVSKYNIIVQENQELVIARTDKITSDLFFYSPFESVKYPSHLTVKGIIETIGHDYTTTISKLHSVGFGTIYNHIEDEIEVSELDFRKEGLGSISLSTAEDFATYPNGELYPNTDLYPGRQNKDLKELILKNKGEGVYPSLLLYPSNEACCEIATQRWIIYKFKLYKKVYENPDYDVVTLVDTGKYYYQSQYIENFGKLKLKIKYERS